MKPAYHNIGNKPRATHKTCDVCGLFLHVDKFKKQHSSFDGHMNTCQKCRVKERRNRDEVSD